MKKIFLFNILLYAASFIHAQHTKKPVHPAVEKTKKKLEDQVRQYFFVMLTSGQSRDQDSVAAATIQAAHMANINKLYYEGKLKVAGPFGDEGNWRGIFIFDCAGKEEVEALLKTDPAIATGRLAYEIHPWWTAETGSFVPGKPKKKS